jgi:putative membrane protein
VVGVDLGAPELEPAGRSARWLDPLGWRYLGVGLLESGAVRARGRWRRSLAYVPYARVQSVSAQQGLVQRRLALATVHLDLPKGSARWTADHRAHADAAALVRQLSGRQRGG